MKSVVLHVGVHKTGTTSLQEALNGYDDGHTFYANLGNPNHSVFFRTLFEQDHFEQHWKSMGLTLFEHNKQVAEYWSTLRDQLSRPRSRIIFSGEEISSLDPLALMRLKEFFLSYSVQLEVIFVVREPLSFTASALKEMVKHGICLQNSSTDGVVIDYSISKRLRSIIECFGRDNIMLLYFEDATQNKHPGGIVDLVANQIGLRKKLILAPHKSNPAISDTTFKLLNQFFQSGIMHSRVSWLISARWEFIAILDALIVASEGPINNIAAFGCKVNWNDYETLNTLLDRQYPINKEMHSSLGPFSSFCADINYQDVHVKIRNHFENRKIRIPRDASTHELLSILFYSIIRDQAIQPFVQKLS